jgi:hypothetical protein
MIAAMGEAKKRAVVDVKQRRPACVLLQAVWGGDSSVVHKLPAESWLLAPTDDMHMVEGTDEQWAQFADELAARFG